MASGGQGRRLRRAAPGARRGVRRLRASTGSRSSTPWPCATLLVGSVLAVVQTDVKRMLAYSSISHAGFILVGVQAATRPGHQRRRSSTSRPTRSWSPAPSASSPSSAARATTPRRSTTTAASPAGGPVLALAFTVFLLAQAGVPFTVGLRRQVRGDRRAPSTPSSYWLAIVAMVSAVIAAFLYLRIIVAMYMAERRRRAAAGPAPTADRMPFGAGARPRRRRRRHRRCSASLPGLLDDVTDDAVPVLDARDAGDRGPFRDHRAEGRPRPLPATWSLLGDLA